MAAITFAAIGVFLITPVIPGTPAPAQLVLEQVVVPMVQQSIAQARVAARLSAQTKFQADLLRSLAMGAPDLIPDSRRR